MTVIVRSEPPIEASPAPSPDAATVRGSRLDRNLLVGLGVIAWVAIVALGRAWGLVLHNEGKRIVLYTPPVLGGYRPSLPSGFWLPIAVAGALVLGLPRLTRARSFAGALVLALVAAAAWWAALASIDGSAGFTRGIEWDREWAPLVPRWSTDPVQALQSFVRDLPSATIQARGHPPGFLMLIGLLDRLGLASARDVAALLFVAGVSSIAAVALTVRLVVDDEAVRRVLPFLALAPAATWFVMSVDTLYLAVTAWMVYLFVRAMKADGRPSTAFALAAGALAFVAALLSYGMVLVGVVPLCVALLDRRWRPLLVAGAAASCLMLALVPLGYSWFAGLAATRHEYATLAVDRPYDFFLVENLAAWALALGPAVVVGLLLLRNRRAWALAGGGLAAALIANVSGLSEGEVERIWLPFSVWLYVAAVALPHGRWSTRMWLSAQAGSALVLNAVIRTYW